MTEQPAVNFAELLKRLRTDAGLTQEELAERAHVSPRSISDLERGINKTARQDTTRLLADALNLSGTARAGFETAARGYRDAEPGLLARPRARARSVAATTPVLPRDIRSFTGREAHLAKHGAIPRASASTRSTVWPGSARARSHSTPPMSLRPDFRTARSSCNCTPTRAVTSPLTRLMRWPACYSPLGSPPSRSRQR